jgi:hypothetical protein
MNEPIFEYYVAQSNSPSGLEEQIRQKLSEGGWELQGGISVCAVQATFKDESEKPHVWYTYAQAMVRQKGVEWTSA